MSTDYLHEISSAQDQRLFPIHVINKAFSIDSNYKTEVVRMVFADKIVFLISQLDSLIGTVIKAEKDASALTMTISNTMEEPLDDYDHIPEPTYSIRTLFGKRAPSLDHPMGETYLDIETIFARKLIEDLYQPKPVKPAFGMMEPPMPTQVLEKPLVLCIAFSKEFLSRLKEPKVGRLVMAQLIDCVVNKL
ncbi:predicted protein [Naegleria gruberi]|uniref:Predicted protein n=1 Tax=Naegleria gruberi TaxID=5762 RepID=D2VAS1_NAEGR|nr:uncharacterized protein NAEGRDRAFT_65956 [Naegleria gruberi]EFC46129.1 predicted protein [Naegleria gruberi]|eukprot:XP_002678873.1 predicted protein [Naegleria gruberi strain NEG-M]